MSLKKKILLGAAAVVLIIAAACGFYINDYYHAGDDAVLAAGEAAADYISQQDGDTLVFLPEGADGTMLDGSGPDDAGLIFYPGGKVEYTAYAPLMEAFAECGVLCVLVEMPGNLAVLDVNAADGYREEFPEIEQWYVGGHSLGGSMAASYAAKHAGDLEGLLLLAAYSTADLNGTGLDVLSVYGSEDGVLNMSKYDEYRQNLPEGEPGDGDGTAGGTKELLIEGGNHAGFGDYGAQEGDGEAAVKGEKQREVTAEAFMEILRGGETRTETQEE